MQSKKIRLLILEDSEEDVLRMRRVLDKAKMNYDVQMVENEERFTYALKNDYPDVILSDYALAGFSGLAAMLLKEQYNRLIPFIFVTGAIKEELASETILSGAYGYVLKSKLEKLPEVIKDAVTDSKMYANFSPKKETSDLYRQNEITKILIAETTNYLKYMDRNNSSQAYIDSIKKHVEFLKNFKKSNK